LSGKNNRIYTNILQEMHALSLDREVSTIFRKAS